MDKINISEEKHTAKPEEAFGSQIHTGAWKNNILWILVGVFIAVAFSQFVDIRIGMFGAGEGETPTQGTVKTAAELSTEVLPKDGVELPIEWGDIGIRLISSGVIDADKYGEHIAQRGGVTEEDINVLTKTNNGRLIMNEQNAGFLLNVFWAFGLANKNPILEEGPMVDAQYGGDAGRFASTGGWTLSSGNPMDHYSKHEFVALTSEQQELVERVSKGIYRPCCGNSVYFPDCNHGMAMLGLLELMASGDATEAEMYRVALLVNSYWFPDTYLTIAKYLESRGIKWSEADPKELLGQAYSSAQGYSRIQDAVLPVQSGGGGGCGV